MCSVNTAAPKLSVRAKLSDAAGLRHLRMQELTNVQFLNLLRHRNIDVSAKEGRLQINAPCWSGGCADARRTHAPKERPACRLCSDARSLSSAKPNRPGRRGVEKFLKHAPSKDCG